MFLPSGQTKMKTIILDKITTSNQNPDAIAIYANVTLKDPLTSEEFSSHSTIGYFTVEELQALKTKIDQAIADS